MDDRISVASLINGDSLAYKVLYDKYARKVYAFAFSYFKSKELAEEIVQDVFSKIWKNRADLREKLSFNSYIFTIAKNLIIDIIRKNSVEALFKKELANNSTISLNSTEDQVVLADYEVIANNAVEQLPPKRKAIFKLSRHQNMSYLEIARYLGISQKTVEAQMNKALKFIKDYLRLHADITTLLILTLCFINRPA